LPPIGETGGLAPLAGTTSQFLDNRDIDHYIEVFDDPDVWFSAVQSCRNAIPFYREIPDPSASTGFRYEYVPNDEVARMWNEPGPDYSDQVWIPVFAPEDRHVVFEQPTMFVYSKVMSPPAFADLPDGAVPADDDFPAINPFTASFRRHFPNLATREVAGGHFMPEEDAVRVTACIREFLES
jgi:hypothetical protein